MNARTTEGSDPRASSRAAASTFVENHVRPDRRDQEQRNTAPFTMTLPVSFASGATLVRPTS